MSRRRGPVLEEAIHQAVLEALVEHGYEGLTMEDVAARAHTGKAALYRRWPTKLELVLDAFVGYLRSSPPEVPASGNLRADIRLVLAELAEAFDHPIARGISAALAELPVAPSRALEVRAATLESRRDLMAEVLAGNGVTKQRSGIIATAAIGALAVHVLVEGLPVPDEVVDAIVDEVVLPLAGAGVLRDG